MSRAAKCRRLHALGACPVGRKQRVSSKLKAEKFIMGVRDGRLFLFVHINTRH